MKKFLTRLLLFAFLFFLFDKLFIPVLFLNPKTQNDRRLELILEGDMNKDIIVLGSSRGARNIIASQLEQQTGLTCYNLSYPGSNVEFHEFVLRSLLKFNKPPKTILLAVDDPLELLPSDLITFRYESLYPFVKYRHVIDEMVERGEKNRVLSELLVLYRMNKSNFNLKQQRFTPYDTLISCGSMPVSFRSDDNFVWDTDSISYPQQNEVSAKIAAFRKINELCAANNIRLVLLFSPNYKNHNLTFEKRMRDLSRKETIIYIYNRSNPVYRDEMYYYDEKHLVRKGAVMFTGELSRFIKYHFN